MNDGLVGGSRAAIYNKRQQQITTISHSFKSSFITKIFHHLPGNVNLMRTIIKNKKEKKKKQTDRQD